MIMPPIRPRDRWGEGFYRASRGDRIHEGVDLACYPSSTLLSFTSGIVERIGYPYSPLGDKAEYRLIEVRYDAFTIIKYFYIEPCVHEGDLLTEGQTLGRVQDLSKVYKGITNHIHFEVWVEGEHTDPLAWLDWYRGMHGIS